MIFKRKAVVSDVFGKLIQSVPSVYRVAPLARGHGGKTSLINCIPRALDTLPSGIRLGYHDPLLLNEALSQVRLAELELRRNGLTPTLERSFRRIGIFHDEIEQFQIEISDEIGQPITSTTPDSSDEQRQKYDEYVESCSTADVLWQLIAFPVTNDPQGLALFREDLARYQCWLSNAIRNRSSENPVSIALVVNKVDSSFESEEQAAAELHENDAMHKSLRPLIDVIRSGIKRGCVTKGALLPVSAFGFGNGQLLPKPEETHTAYEDQEEEYVLGEHGRLDPFNVLTLLSWSVYACVAMNSKENFGPLEKELEADLKTFGRWITELH